MTPDVALAFSALFTMLITLVVFVIGLRVKDSQDKKIAILSTELEMQSHRGKLTFEKEFEILSQLWGAFVNMRQSSLALDAAWDGLGPNATDKSNSEERKERLETFEKYYVEFRNIVHKNRPFYPQEIHDMMIDFIAMTKDMEYLYSHNPPSLGEDPEYWKTVRELADSIRQVSNTLCDAIRKSFQPLDAKTKETKCKNGNTRP
jgi:Mg2+ and Co2+ transporter CorA